MCWSREASLVTFVIAILGSVYLFKRNRPNDRWVALFAVIVAMIQLAEFFMWSDQTCGKINQYASMFALIILALEPMANMFGGIYLSNSPNKSVLRGMLLAYVIFIAFTYVTKVHGKDINWCGTSNCSAMAESMGSTTQNNIFPNGKSCNLRWFFTENMDNATTIIWILFLMLPFLTMTPRIEGLLILAFGIITYTIAAKTNNNVAGSLWCWLAIGVIFLKIVIG